ncbi:LysR substrate-binding domain-containing protein [Granulibacter bethesdensis]|uniref:Transcriptional regulator, LysR family n=1 Tax=Granulibacter bethesdensis (strain ATCC BAA-1260 / CGDNIH1) TaxID=391165 RepID=Q0BTA6_GRABC|nr:LysR substrate-binding domain-containing protein [Granulibacter bethesdensis]ABI61946.1 Transcriptional regulator, LysR family [Granulibacter bethesdensis CGDNIH1]APG30615.1 Transcriptional regulator, LysR family [Granulibacter bethesdensis]APH51762.1 Transcriptional regulator, LysR family [Granulibacter bethesdensis]APH64454.1 Transcriptional regulator, LysR family [Granulibacter bethesdensis]
MAAIDEAVNEVAATSATPGGTVRLNLPRIAAELALSPLFVAFAEAFPKVTLDLTIDDGISDIVADGFDAGIRIGGRLVQDMAAVPLTPDIRNAVVGSPAYFGKRPAPQHPRDLLHHACLNYRWAKTHEVYRWRFEENGRALELSVDGGLVASDTGVLCDAALAGMGLACLPDLLVAPLVTSGRLVRVLEPYCPIQAGFFLYYPLNRHPSGALRAFIDFARAQAPIA